MRPPLFLLVWLCCGALYAAELATLPAIANLRAVLQDETSTIKRDSVEYLIWRSHWVLQWDAVPGAAEYELVYRTSEGVSKQTRLQKDTVIKLEVAKGENPNAQGMSTRQVQLATIQSLLAVSVVARAADGARSMPSPWLSVGRRYP